MIAAASLPSELRVRMKKMAPGDSVSVRTWKGDRGFLLTCISADTFTLDEDGFENRQWTDLNANAVLKTCRTIAKREFPRSNKLRLQTNQEASHG